MTEPSEPPDDPSLQDGVGWTAPTALRREPAPRLHLTVDREAGHETSRELTVDGARLRIGSHPTNDVILNDPAVSRFHCVIERTDTAWRLVDSSSRNGTSISGVPVRDADIPPECTVVIGGSSLRVKEIPAVASVELLDQASFGEIYGHARPMQRLFAILDKVAASDANVLVEGESGTGKELVATEIVRRGSRRRKPFVIVDCGAISPSLIEAELFGHARGAFTGADRDRSGAFEAAHGGTVFLDEVGELPLEMQPKLLRALEAREIRRIGEVHVRRVDVRVIAATNRELEREVNRGRFREDLFYRLSVVRVRVPPLRERPEDIETLIRVFLKALDANDEQRLFTPTVLDALRRYDWPGNVRELRNYVERSVVLDATAPAGSGGLGARSDGAEVATDAPIDLEQSFRQGKELVVDDYERRYVTALMRWSGGNISRAARKANMDRMNLYRILQRHGLRVAATNND